MSIKKRLKMVKLKLKYKKDSKEGKQGLQKDNPINLIDAYFTLTKKMFKVKNLSSKKSVRYEIKSKTL